mmetsp:Transcript_37150/g.37820  ORF Transcript_37150/g.37820 Transcript_37150/m.37820 type:complete len:127 (+) Transcript_37150:78-458(+)|eukprot:CAMPEP_0182422786 /NCGR_PEP_ID=MMETSP1167-20130531/8578_1 /TAXON_ID=2988 /ORGANISM="Mallomonas Sp, Strain CCMP3275" /LENGTH=126 /DNA_ID=CAMNT_0024601147 /DNA_START=78 /DNA_END=458 /DNA_ORIENTATION=-
MKAAHFAEGDDDKLSGDEYEEEEQTSPSGSGKMPRGGSKQLTMKYNMAHLRILHALDLHARTELGVIYKCDADDVPLELELPDILRIKNVEERRKELLDILSAVPEDVSSLADHLLSELSKLDDTK